MSKNSKNILKQVINAVNNLKTKQPLIDCITNTVTINDCANAILAIGGSPAMADDVIESVDELVKISNAIVINLGTLSNARIKTILKAATYASERGIPIILDPVAVGVTSLRNEIASDLIKDYNITAIRGNMTEIKTIATLFELDEMEGVENNVAKGVEVAENDIINENNLEESCSIIKALSEKIGASITATGPIDVVSNGKTSYALRNGDYMMRKITGSGCMLTSVIGAFCGANEPFISSIAGALAMGIAGENAKTYVDESKAGTGTFRTKLIDYLYLLNEDEIINKSKITPINKVV